MGSSDSRLPFYFSNLLFSNFNCDIIQLEIIIGDSNMKYYIAADGGGSKLLAVLYDEKFNIISRGACGGTNHLFRPSEEIKRDVEALADELIPEEITEIEGFDYSIVGDPQPLIEAIRGKAKINSCKFRGEGNVALLSSGYEYGILAQAGTGSDAFLIQPNATIGIGGWGVYFGDEHALACRDTEPLALAERVPYYALMLTEHSAVL